MPRIAGIVATALLSLTGPSLFAEEQAAKSPKVVVSPSAELAQKMLAQQIKSTEESLRRLTEQAARTNDPAALEAQKAVERIFDLENRVLKLSQGEQTESTKSEIEKIANEMVQAAADLQLKSLREKRLDSSADNQQLQQVKDQLVEREKQLTKARQLVEQQRRPALPPLENGTMKIYKLSFSPARDAAQTIESLFGNQAVRLAVDERGNTLIVYSKPDSLPALDSLVTRLDEEAGAATGSDKSKQSGLALPRSLLLRVFWLADGSAGGQAPAEFLPESVIQATKKLGLDSPHLVTQTVTSLALGREDGVDFSNNVPAMLFSRPVALTCQGRIKLVSDDRVRLDMGVHVIGSSINCDLTGSLATPLGHYMVMGTTNSVVFDDGQVPPSMEGGSGMGPGGPGAGRYAWARPGQPGARSPGGLAAAPGAEAGEFGPGMAPGAAGAAADPNGPQPGAVPTKAPVNTSRFAFVVQVVEGQSYPAEEKEKFEGKQFGNKK